VGRQKQAMITDMVVESSEECGRRNVILFLILLWKCYGGYLIKSRCQSTIAFFVATIRAKLPSSRACSPCCVREDRFNPLLLDASLKERCNRTVLYAVR